MSTNLLGACTRHTAIGNSMAMHLKASASKHTIGTLVDDANAAIERDNANGSMWLNQSDEGEKRAAVRHGRLAHA